MARRPHKKLDSDWVLQPRIAALLQKKARRLAKSPGFTRSDEPDIEQELRLHLLAKTSKFNASRASLETFASRLLKHRIISLARRVGAKKCDYRRNDASLNDKIHDREGGSVELVDTIETLAGRRHTGQRVPSQDELKQLAIDVADTNRSQSAELRTFAALLSHVSEFAAAQVMGISRRRAAGHVAALRALYEERGLCA
jgi:hypothetical protein